MNNILDQVAENIYCLEHKIKVFQEVDKIDDLLAKKLKKWKGKLFMLKRQYKYLKQMDDLDVVLEQNSYINSCNSNKCKDVNSLSYLIEQELSQSDCIKLGNALESVLRDLILFKNKSLTNIKSKNKKGIKEKDHLFIDDEKKIIYYAEIKSNLNLDTEKSKMTCEKCIQIKNELTEEFKNYDIQMFLIGTRYLKKDYIPVTIRNKYKIIDDNLLGLCEYLNKLSCDVTFTLESYKIFLNKIVTKMFS